MALFVHCAPQKSNVWMFFLSILLRKKADNLRVYESKLYSCSPLSSPL